MSKLIDMTGQVFGGWTVIGLGELRDNRRYWLCQCACGTRGQIPGKALRRGDSRGCFRCSRKRLYCSEDALLRRHAATYRRDALRRGLDWALTADQAVALFRAPCDYCGQVPVMTRRGRAPVCTGIDRERNDEGYTLENSVPCCKECNFAKGTRSRAEFTAWIQRAAAWLSA